MFGQFGRSSLFGPGNLTESAAPMAGLRPRSVARYVSYCEEQAARLGLINPGQPLQPEHYFELIEHAVDTDNARLEAEATNAIEVISLTHAEGDGRCPDCGGVTCGGKGLGEGAEFTYVPAFDLVEAGNPWHDPKTGQFGRPSKSLASFKFKKTWSKGSFKHGVNAAKTATIDIGKTKKVRGQPCGCKERYPSGGCKTKHAAVCRELAFGGAGKALAAATSAKRKAAKAAKALDAARAAKTAAGYKRSLAAQAAVAKRKAAKAA